MKLYIYAIIALSLCTFSVRAQGLQVVGPNGSTIVFNQMNCPDGIACVQANKFGASPGFSGSVILLPNWAASLITNSAPSPEISAYAKGISDSITIDICNYCNCCIVKNNPGFDFFTPWERNQFNPLINLTPFGAGQ